MNKTIKKPTVTIGIPAYNEEANIGFLLKSIMKQQCNGFVIEKILINSDGSTDRTVEIVKALNIENLQIIDNRDRKGVAIRQNELMQKANSEILILLNADIALGNDQFLARMVETVIKRKADLVSSLLSIVPPKTRVEKILSTGLLIKQNAFRCYKNGNNVYTCNGTARAFSKALYKKIIFQSSIGEDMYSYLFCISNGYKYFPLDNEVVIKLPDNILDHYRQSNRYISSIAEMKQYFNSDFLKKELEYPVYIIIKSILLSLIRQPYYTLRYLWLFVISRLFRPDNITIQNAWQMSDSSKNLSYYYENK